MDQCEGVHHELSLSSLGPALFSENGNVGPTDNGSSQINSVIYNIKIVDCPINFRILLFKEEEKNY